MNALLQATTAYDTAMITAKNRPLPTEKPQNAARIQAPGAMAKIEESAKDFEAMFLAEMFGHMFEGVGNDPLFGGGKGEEMFRSLMVNEYAKNIASGPGIGISQDVKAMMIQMQQQGG